MKFSICIPQYNRIDYLIKSLDELQNQDYLDFEVVISDDCSQDDTTNQIQEYLKSSKYPITYFRFEQNQGYDRNLRKSMELAVGDYCFVLGNDDTLSHSHVLSDLKDFLVKNNLPDLGFCNYQEYSKENMVTRRALASKIIGSGPDIGLKNYSCFSFVAGLIFKKTTFDQYNTEIFDKSIYAQIALALMRKDREIALHGRETGRVVRLPHGEYIEVHEPMDEYELYKLVGYKAYEPMLARSNAKGVITLRSRIRAALSRFYFEDRVVPPTKGEIEAAHDHGKELH